MGVDHAVVAALCTGMGYLLGLVFKNIASNNAAVVKTLQGLILDLQENHREIAKEVLVLQAQHLECEKQHLVCMVENEKLTARVSELERKACE